MSNIYFPLCSFVIIILINIIFFHKKKIDNDETKIYGVMIFINLLESFFACLIIAIGLVSGILDIHYFLNKLDYFLILFWVWGLFVYIYNLSKTKQLKKVFNLSLILNIIVMIVIVFTPINIINENGIMDSNGLGTTILFATVGVYLLLIIISIFKDLIKNPQNIRNKKYFPLYALIVLSIAMMVIRVLFPGLTLISFVLTYVDLIMYFTIENPDMHLIEQLNIARDQAEKANNAKTDFLSNMSHEIRTPLNAIVGFSQALLEEDINDRAKDEVKDIMMASENLLDIVNGILDISKIEANKLEIINKEYQFSKIIDELVSLSKGRIGEKPLEFKINIDQTIPPVLYGDYIRLKQIMLNLLTNAIKYTKEGYVDFTVSCVKKDDVCRLIIAVEDSGIGIKNEKIDRLFTKFERFEMDKNTTIEGTGLGLAITKKLVDLMGGNIVVQSEYGHGSKFTVAIDQHIIKNPKKLENTAVLEKVIDATNKRVLIVDDNNINLKVATRLLQSYNVISEEVSSGQECIEKIKNKEKFDLILLDIMMPVMNGVDTLGILKKEPDFDIPVVALTADAISGMKEKYLSDGFDGYLAKPINKVELNRIINQFLSK